MQRQINPAVLNAARLSLMGRSLLLFFVTLFIDPVLCAVDGIAHRDLDRNAARQKCADQDDTDYMNIHSHCKAPPLCKRFWLD